MAWLSGQQKADLERQLEQARKSLAEGMERRREEREARAKARGKAPVDPEEAKQERKAKTAKAKALTKMLVPLASIGAREAIEKAMGEGASLKAALDGGRNPAMAAIDGGHKELALWLCQHPDHLWHADSRGSCADTTELSSAINADDAELCEALLALRPSLIEESNGGQRGYAQHNRRSTMNHAMSGFPKAAAWLAGKRPELAKKWAGSQAASEVTGALCKALEQGDFESAAKLWPLTQKAAEGPGKIAQRAGAGFNAAARDLLAAALKTDNAEALGWLLARSPALAAKTLDGGAMDPEVGGGVNFWNIIHSKDNRWAAGLEAAVKEGQASPGGLGLWAAREGALECFEFLMSIDLYKEKFAQAQSEGMGWIFALAEARDPAMVAAMERCGFDFSLEAAPGWSSAALILASGRAPTQKWLEMVGRERPSWLAPSKASGLGPFEMARRTRHPDANLSKWEAFCEKAAMKSSAGRLRQTKQAKEARQSAVGRARL